MTLQTEGPYRLNVYRHEATSKGGWMISTCVARRQQLLHKGPPQRAQHCARPLHRRRVRSTQAGLRRAREYGVVHGRALGRIRVSVATRVRPHGRFTTRTGHDRLLESAPTETDLDR
eukprot:6665038-Prymnesium_polylepis.2